MGMFRRFSVAALVLLSVFSASMARAQLEVGIKCDANKYIMGEKIVMKMMIRNSTDEPLVFNDVYHNATLELGIIFGRQLDGIPVRKKLKHDFVVMSGDTITEYISMNELYKFQCQGCYQVSITVHYNGRTYTSAPFGFDVVDGIEILSRKKLLKNHPDIVLTYSLRYLDRNSRETAFIVITDKEHQVLYGTFRLGPILRVHKPVLSFNDDGKLVCVHQSGANRFTRSVISVSANSAKFERQTQHRANGDLIRARKKLKEAKLRG